MGMYILKHMNKAMLAGDGVLTMLGREYVFDYIAVRASSHYLPGSPSIS